MHSGADDNISMIFNYDACDLNQLDIYNTTADTHKMI